MIIFNKISICRILLLLINPRKTNDSPISLNFDFMFSCYKIKFQCAELSDFFFLAEMEYKIHKNVSISVVKLRIV